jgi:hypothetical protein
MLLIFMDSPSMSRIRGAALGAARYSTPELADLPSSGTGNWPGSLFASQDGVAIDSVGLDFLRSEWPRLADLSYCDNYMREAALADDPPSKTFYDPERDGTKCISLGIHEHWNNSADKKYSRSLGKKQGIELYTGPI